MEYILFKKTARQGHNGVTFWRLTFYCIDDGTIWEMTVDNTYRNFDRSGWDHIVNDPEAWCVFGGLKRTAKKTREGTPVLSADSRATVVYRCENQQQAFDLIQADLDQRQPQTYREFFQ